MSSAMLLVGPLPPLESMVTTPCPSVVTKPVKERSLLGPIKKMIPVVGLPALEVHLAREIRLDPDISV